MSPAVDNSGLSLPAQSRRLACDRCHQHKLKCERDDAGSINGAAESSPPPCKRCMKAQVLCQISSNNSSNSSNTDNSNKRGAKRKGVHAEDGEPHERTISADKVFPTAFPNDVAVSPDPATSFGPSGASVPSTDEASLFNFGSFDFGTGDFTGGWFPAVSPTSALAGTAAPWMQSIAAEDAPSTALSAEPDSSSLADAMHDDCRKRLQSLHMTIFGELHHLSGADVEHLLSGSYATTSLMHPQGGDRCDDKGSFVHKLHVATERLIKLMRVLAIACAGTNRGHNPATYVSVSSTQACSACDAIPSGLHHQHSATSTSLSNLTFLGSRRNSSTFSSSAPPPPPTSCSAVDLPIIVSFLTCYVGLVVIYRNVLTQALHSLRSKDQYRHIQSRQGSTGSTIAGSSSGKSSSGSAATTACHSYHGGSSSSNAVQQALRMRIQTEMLSHMIERVEDASHTIATGVA
ncbi:fungal zn(2)-Cys(6) binuclear cluster domain-containing protein [Apiospora kogelbergensis]|uniref:fungal zn(2)-Cys(6) binuclear cluster domain-containing protein n=1 Tax=Apiospora kogelbergensis TaxID=1337665 RepID=UPI0031300FFF